MSNAFCPSLPADISTSFRKGPVPRPLVNTPQHLVSQEEEPMIGIPPPASVNLLGGVGKDIMPAGWYPAQQSGVLSQPEAITGLSLGEPCRIGRATFEPVVAAAAVAAVPTQELGFVLDSPSVSSLDSSSASSADSMEDADGMLWADADPLAALDRVLDSLLVVPTMPTGLTSTPKPSSASATPSTSFLTSSSLLADVPASTAAPKKKSTSSSGASSKSPAGSQASGRPSRSYMQSLSAAAAAPAVTVIHCETEYERELEAAAALQQLLVVKVESSQNLVRPDEQMCLSRAALCLLEAAVLCLCECWDWESLWQSGSAQPGGSSMAYTPEPHTHAICGR